MDFEQRKRKAESMRGRESRRHVSIEAMEVREADDGQRIVEGYASTTGRAYDMGWYQETITRGAFATTLRQQPDVQLLLNHDGLPLARTTNGSLDLREDDSGLAFTARLAPDDPDPNVRVVLSKIGSGLMDQCSFAFRVLRQTWDEDYENREINEVDLNRGDVSIVNYGANPLTPVTARSLFSELGELSDEDIDQLRGDPTVMTVVRRLTPAVAGQIPPPEGISLDTWKARAYALGLRAS